MRTLLIAVALSLMSACAARAPHTVSFDSALLRELVAVQRTVPLEVALCLRGFTANGIVFVEYATPATMLQREAYAAVFAPCEGRRLVGWYHNHPASGWANCGFSETDLRSHERMGLPIALASCDPLGDSARVAFVYRLQTDSIDQLVSPVLVDAIVGDR